MIPQLCLTSGGGKGEAADTVAKWRSCPCQRRKSFVAKLLHHWHNFATVAG